MTDLRDKVAQVKSQLPDDASDPTVMSIDIDSMPVVSVALRGNDLASLQSIAEDEIQPALERLDGVASVDISGGYEQEIAVHTDASRLKGYNPVSYTHLDVYKRQVYTIMIPIYRRAG